MDANNSHKLGWNGGKNDRTSFMQRQRVSEAIGAGFFSDVSYVGDPLTTYEFMGIENGGV
ncbi:hypothetical protein ASF69_10425 [Rhizobium sp. Leaf311]|uniref:hypothetical protein n=1 Tax=Rhizobium sp. Leaf311 TaxID=1736332 RepID=UPI000715FC57|nr:hypothetical protein [Rhizobium sp. Leaf311]KQQ59557.1 hypothetical protein ASF69_10425 [Rhizobium sp. Leaf311]